MLGMLLQAKSNPSVPESLRLCAEVGRLPGVSGPEPAVTQCVCKQMPKVYHGQVCLCGALLLLRATARVKCGFGNNTSKA
jgi:hypothetical protein